MDNTKRFNGKGAVYAKARPQYAKELFAYFKNELHLEENCVFADIGSGAGIFTKQLLKCGYRVFGVEPNEDMRQKAEESLKKYPGFCSVDGSDADTKLKDASIDVVTVAQAFHWFDAKLFQKECARILKPEGKIILIYNSQDETAECTKALKELHSRYQPEFRGFSNGMTQERCVAFFGGDCDIFRADNTQHYHREAYVNRVLSSSYSLTQENPCYERYLTEIHAIFDTYAKDGTLSVPMETIAYIGMVEARK